MTPSGRARKYVRRSITTREGQPETQQVIGVRGLKNLGGRVQEEYLTKFQSWDTAVKIYIEMLDDITIASARDALTLPLLAADFDVEAASDSIVDQAAANWLWDAINNMDRQTWRSHVADMLYAPWFGWALAEIVLEKRRDGRLWLRNIDPRGQETLHKWEFDENDHTTDFVQQDPDTGAIHTIPMWKTVHASFRGRKGNPQGRGLLRTLYRTWRFVKELENLEGIGLERNVGGMPVAKLPAEPLSDQDLTDLKSALQNLRMDEEMYLITPNGLEISPYSGSINVTSMGLVIDRKQKEMLQLVFAQFIKLGMSSVGTQALVKGSQDFFLLGLESVQQELVDMWNQQLIPLLFRFNQFSFPGMTGFPKLNWDKPGKVDIDSILNAYNTAVSAQVMTATKQDEEHFRAVMDLPDLPEGAGEGPREPEQPQRPFHQDADMADQLADAAPTVPLNGIQIRSLMEVIKQVATNELPASLAVSLIRASFPALTEELIQQMVNDAERFTPQSLQPDDRSQPQRMPFSEDPNLRSGGGEYEDTTNALQRQLLNVYDGWAVDTRDLILKAQSTGVPSSQFERIIAGKLANLEEELVSALDASITNATQKVLSRRRLGSRRVQAATRKLSGETASHIKTTFGENLHNRLSKHLQRKDEFSRSDLVSIFDTARASIANLAGTAWQSIFLALQAAGQDKEEEEGRTQRVRWILNDRAEHCSDSPGRFGCPSMAGVYNSWAELETVPAGLTTCRGNCRCRLEVESEPGSDVWVRGLPEVSL